MFQITLKFLEAVQHNNTTDWLHANYDLYLQEKKRFSNFMQKILEEAKKLNPERSDLEIKKCLFRFNRDIRYKKDKSPYKDHFGVEFAIDGKRSWYPCFYFELRPGGSFVGIGTRRSSPALENKMRKHAILNFEKRKKLQNWTRFRSFFGWMLLPKDEKSFIWSYKSMYSIKKALPDWDPMIQKLNPERALLRSSKCSYQKATASISQFPPKDQKYFEQLCFIKDRLWEIPISDKVICSEQLFETLKKALETAMPMLLFLQEWCES